jgi:hypothetical protein
MIIPATNGTVEIPFGIASGLPSLTGAGWVDNAGHDDAAESAECDPGGRANSSNARIARDAGRR